MAKKTIHAIFLMAVSLVLAGLSGALPGSGWAWTAPQGQAKDQPAATAVIHVRVFDGEKLIPSDTVIIKNGRIEAVGKNLAPPPGAAVIDGRGQTLLPGLIDAHIHTLSMDNLKQCLVFGVTSVVDMFTDVKLMQQVKQLQAAGKASDLAFFISAGTLATVPHGHGTEYGLVIPTLTRPEEAAAWVEARLAEGSDFVKIIYDDGGVYGLRIPTLNLDTIRALVDEAHRHGKLAVVHAGTLRNCLDVLEARADGLAHLYFEAAFDAEFGRITAAHKAFVIPTLTVLNGIAGLGSGKILSEDQKLSPYLKPADRQSLRTAPPIKTGEAAYRAAEKALTQLQAAGVPILAGTDSGNPNTTHGASLHDELGLLVKAGLKPMEALRTATSLPAEKFSLAGRGRIKPGSLADLLLVKGDPTQDILATRDIVMVWKEGKAVDREAYHQAVQKEWEAVNKLKSSPPPPHSESGWVSDFEGDKVAANFGSGWVISTDAVMGGKSTAQFKLAEGGAEGSRQSLLISGTLKEGAAFRWAGAMFVPGKTFVDPANLSLAKALRFFARGQGAGFAVLVFSRSGGFIPGVRAFQAGPEWKEYIFPWEDFNIEGYDVTGIFIGAYQKTGDFSLQVDNVRLK
jgi:imidazolonepropionase-like amidohydrolase